LRFAIGLVRLVPYGVHFAAIIAFLYNFVLGKR
jgi:hypothetical protein